MIMIFLDIKALYSIIIIYIYNLTNKQSLQISCLVFLDRMLNLHLHRSHSVKETVFMYQKLTYIL